MTIFFQPDIVAFGDRIGFGWWLDTHNEEHSQFASLGQTGSLKFSAPPYDLTGWTWTDPLVMTDWLSVHAAIHDVLRQATGISGLDLADVDFNKQEFFQIWMDAHAAEHRALRTALGVTI